jgi:hypothetical protein
MVWLVIAASRTFVVERTVRMIALADTIGAPLVFPSPSPRRAARSQVSERAPGARRVGPTGPVGDTAVAFTELARAVAVVPLIRPDTTTRRAPAVRADQGRRAGPGGRADSSAAPIGTHRRLGAALGDGTLWAEAARLGRDAARAGAAGALRPTEVASAVPLDSAERREKMDSVVKARLLTFLAALPPDSFAFPKPQAWTTEIDGKTWGIDGQWIYLGGLKLPTALLALLPLPSGNYDQAQQAANLQRMRADILQAAQRAQTRDDFNKYVKEIRERNEAARQFEKNRAGQVAKDTVIKQ